MCSVNTVLSKHAFPFVGGSGLARNLHVAPLVGADDRLVGAAEQQERDGEAERPPASANQRGTARGRRRSRSREERTPLAGRFSSRQSPVY